MIDQSHSRNALSRFWTLGFTWVLAVHLGISSSLASTISSGDVVAYWPADGGTDDLSDSGNHGTLHNGATYGSGRFGRAFSFDGVDDYFSSTAVNLPAGSADRSITFWIKSPDVTVPNKMLLGWGNADTALTCAVVLGLQNLPSGKIAFWGYRRDVEGGITLSDNTWHHIGFTLTGGDAVKLYVDGDIVATATLSSPLNTPTGSTFYMADFIGTMTNFQGLLDDVAIFSRALSDQEVGEIAGGAYIPYPDANPTIRISRPDGASIRLDFLGVLQTSSTLEPGSWSDVLAACSPYFVATGGGGKIFYRARMP